MAKTKPKSVKITLTTEGQTVQPAKVADSTPSSFHYEEIQLTENDAVVLEKAAEDANAPGRAVPRKSKVN